MKFYVDNYAVQITFTIYAIWLAKNMQRRKDNQLW